MIPIDIPLRKRYEKYQAYNGTELLPNTKSDIDVITVQIPISIWVKLTRREIFDLIKTLNKSINEAVNIDR